MRCFHYYYYDYYDYDDDDDDYYYYYYYHYYHYLSFWIMAKYFDAHRLDIAKLSPILQKLSSWFCRSGFVSLFLINLPIATCRFFAKFIVKI